MASRKRTRSVAFETSASVDAIDFPNTKIIEEALEERGSEVWDAFREEYYEVLEQLPLTLHRSFALMRELDDQSTEHKRELLQTLLQYIELRRTLTHSDVLIPKEEDSLLVQVQAPASQRESSPPRTSQQILSRIAWLAEEVVRASDEKVNVAKTAYESADRQIRFLDFAIQEQETSLTLGLRPGTKPLHNLYGSAVGRYVRPPLEGAPEQNAEDDGAPTLGVVDREASGSAAVPKVARRGKKGRRGKKTMIQEQPSANSSLKVTVPPLPAIGPDPAIAADPNEPRYCYCNQVSFGEMIACDNEKCEVEWFHFGCAGITTLPEGRWYCRDCQAFMKLSRGRRGR